MTRRRRTTSRARRASGSRRRAVIGHLSRPTQRPPHFRAARRRVGGAAALLLPLGWRVLGIACSSAAVVFTRRRRPQRGRHAIRHGLREGQLRRHVRADLRQLTGSSLTVDASPSCSRRPAETATVHEDHDRAGRPRPSDDRFRVPVKVTTELFGSSPATSCSPIVKDERSSAVDWSQALSFPGLRAGETAPAHHHAPPRADILASDGTALVQGANRIPTSDAALSSIVGQIGPIPAGAEERLRQSRGSRGRIRRHLRSRARLRGAPARRSRRHPLRRRPRARQRRARRGLGRPHHDPAQRAARRGRRARRALGGIAAIKPSDGAILALAGVGVLRPPAPWLDLQDRHRHCRRCATTSPSRRPSTRVETAATLSGVELQNANGESCGGTLAETLRRTPATRSSPRSAPRSVASISSQPLRRSASTTISASPAQRPARSRRPTSSVTTTSSSAPPPSAKARVQATALQMALVAGDDRRAR